MPLTVLAPALAMSEVQEGEQKHLLTPNACTRAHACSDARGQISSHGGAQHQGRGNCKTRRQRSRIQAGLPQGGVICCRGTRAPHSEGPRLWLNVLLSASQSSSTNSLRHEAQSFTFPPGLKTSQPVLDTGEGEGLDTRPLALEQHRSELHPLTRGLL